MSYQVTDSRIIEYGDIALPGTPLLVRGPLPNFEKGDYISFLGAAQTYGRFVEKPYPKILAELGPYESLNLGFGGAGPEHYLPRRNLLDIVNRGRAAVVQVMSARSVSNSYFINTSSDRLVPRDATLNRDPTSSLDAWGALLSLRGAEFVRKLVFETREIYVSRMATLLAKIKVPTILFYFSTRQPNYCDAFQSIGQVFNEFPHMVNERVLDEIKARATFYVECISRVGLPQPLYYKNSSTLFLEELGIGPLGFNNYYPSPAMHELAAEACAPVVREL